MATITPVIDDVSPAPDAKGIPIRDQVKVTFNEEMDESTINTGSFVVTAPDTGVTFGENFNLFDDPELEDVDLLSSPYFGGYVKGTVSFSRVDASGGVVDDETTDYSGDGTLWRTVAIFTPEKPLAPNKTYTVIIAGDEVPEDVLKTGVTSRSVFDANPTLVSGTGNLISGGGYTGEDERTYTVKIKVGGTVGNATYEWWNNNDPETVFQGISTTGNRELEDGLYITFDPDGTLVANDTWEIVVIPAIVMTTNYSWSFTTGSGAIITPSSTYSASGIEELSTAVEGGLKVLSITPKNLSCNLDPDEFTQIVIKFNKEVDESTVTDETILLWSESVNGDSQFTSTGTLAKVISVDGDTVTLQIN